MNNYQQSFGIQICDFMRERERERERKREIKMQVYKYFGWCFSMTSAYKHSLLNIVSS